MTCKLEKEYLRTLVWLGWALLSVGCRPNIPEPFDGVKAFAETKALLQISPRNAGTESGRMAAIHLEARLKRLGFKTVMDSFSEENSAGNLLFNNVLGRLPGQTERLIVLASHFDTKAGIADNFQGANDSGSSSGVLLELARVFATRAPLETGLLFCFLDGEECRTQYGPHDGLHGSRRLANQILAGGEAEWVEAVMVLDMVGDKDLNIVVPRNSSKELVKALFFATHEVGVRSLFSWGSVSIIDDHVPFLLAGFPAIDLIDFEYGSLPGLNDYWHTTNDTLDKLSVESLQTVGDVVVQMVENMQ